MYDYMTRLGHSCKNSYSWKTHFVLQPYFWKSGRMTFTLSKLQSSITGVKTPRIEVFFISLESYRSVDAENGLAWAIWTFAAQVMTKRKVESQIGSLTPDH
jgi:hypothetical protein